MWAEGEGGLRVVWDDSWNSWVIKPSQRRLQRILSDPLPPLPPSMRQQAQQQAQQAQQVQQVQQQAQQQAQQVQQQAQQQLEQQAHQQQEAEKAKLLEQQLQAEREKKARDDAADAAAMAKQLALLRQPPPWARLAADMAAPPAELSFEESRWWCHQAKASSEEPATQPPLWSQLQRAALRRPAAHLCRHPPAACLKQWHCKVWCSRRRPSSQRLRQWSSA